MLPLARTPRRRRHRRRQNIHFLFPFILPILLISSTTEAAAASAQLEPAKNRCYSCASDNLKENFLARSRGPPGRVREPRLFDSMCDLDTWLIREKSAIECQGACFKWQQVLNNSGVFSYATIRGCYERMFDSTTGPTPSPPGPAAAPYTTECKHVQSPLACLDEYSDLEESTCWCFGDFCNRSLRAIPSGIFPLIICISFCFFVALWWK